MVAHTRFVYALSYLLVASARQFTVKNNCAFTIWPAVFTDLNVAKAVPDVPTGWEAPAGSSRSFTVPDDWKSGRIWGRRECSFTSSGSGSCKSGGCNGGFECNPHTGTGFPPVTLAEWTLTSTGTDFYDVSLVDGFNLPMAITSNHPQCSVASCPADLAATCPSALKGVAGEDGSNLACKTACGANLDGNFANSPNCCTGDFSTPDKCPKSGVAYYSFFKQSCPHAYAFAYDDSSSLFSCAGNLKADYTLTFCPDGNSTTSNPPEHIASPVQSSAAANPKESSSPAAEPSTPASPASARPTCNRRRRRSTRRSEATRSHKRRHARAH